MALDGPEYTDTWFSLLFSGLVSKVSLARKLRWASFPNGPGFAAFLAILLLMPAFRKSRLVSTVIEELTKAGKFREAIVVTDTVFQEWFWRASEFERIAKAAAEAGDFVHATSRRLDPSRKCRWTGSCLLLNSPLPDGEQ